LGHGEGGLCGGQKKHTDDGCALIRFMHVYSGLFFSPPHTVVEGWLFGLPQCLGKISGWKEGVYSDREAEDVTLHPNSGRLEDNRYAH
jgi:hypothetical protein